MVSMVKEVINGVYKNEGSSSTGINQTTFKTPSTQLEDQSLSDLMMLVGNHQ